MKSRIILLALPVLFASCSIMHKHVQRTHTKTDSTAITHTDAQTIQSVTATSHDTVRAVSSHTVTTMIDTTISVQGDIGAATFPDGVGGSSVLPDGDTVTVEDAAGKTTVKVSTPTKKIPIKINQTTRSVDTSLTIGAHAATQRAKTDQISVQAIQTHSQTDKTEKTKEKKVNWTMFAFGVSLLLIVLCVLVYEFMKKE